MAEEDKGNKPRQTSDPGVPFKRSSANNKWYAIIAVLIVIIAAFGVLAFYHPVSDGTSAEITHASSVAQYNTPYNLSILTNGKFNSIDLYWGDGPTQVIPYSGTDNVTISHTYTSAGSYYIYYEVNYPGSVYSGNNQIVSVGVNGASAIPSTTNSYGNILVQSASSPPVVNNSRIYAPGTTLSLLVGYFTPPANPSFQVISQNLVVTLNGTVQNSFTLPYTYNATTGAYTLLQDIATYNLSLSTGYYQFEVKTYTAAINSTTGAVEVPQGIFQTDYFLDIPVFSTAKEYHTSTGKSLIMAELEDGGYITLDPQIALDSVSAELIFNTMATLVDFNGSSSTSFHPYLAAYLPTTGNGGINTNWANYTVNVNRSTAGYSGSYKVAIQPYENYTFHIRSNATFQDGSPLTAYDVAFSYVRDMLFVLGSPPTPGMLIAPDLLPGNYFASNSYWNITQNITWNNATDNVTFHFQKPMTPSEVFSSVGRANGAQVVDAAWVKQHGGGITWNASGFKAYQKHANANDYIAYLQNHLMASGPYMISYTVPASEVVLTTNPNYNPPGNGWNPVPKISTVTIEYISQVPSQYLQLKSGFASAAESFPTSNWNEIQSLEAAGTVKAYSYPTPAISFYYFNANINVTSLTKTYFSTANVPQTFFDSIQVRRAFADAYNYSFYLSHQLGNAVFGTSFGTGFNGAIPQGLPGHQSNSSLRAAGVSVPQFSLKYAKQNWTEFVNSQYFSKEGLSNGTGGTILYKGNPLVIPIFILAADPVNNAGATSWGGELGKVITGVTLPVSPVTVPVLEGAVLGGSNPFPLYWFEYGSPVPDNSLYLVPLALPSTASVFLGASGFYPAWFSSLSNPVSSLNGMMQQYVNLTSMNNYFASGSSAASPAAKLRYFGQMNEMFVNMTMWVPLYQVNGQYVFSSSINSASVTDYNENTFGYLLYNYLDYTK